MSCKSKISWKTYTCCIRPHHNHYVPSIVNRSAVMDLHRSRSCATLIQLLYDIFVHSLMLSVHIVLGPLRRLLPFILPSISNRCIPFPIIICPKYWHFLYNDILRWRKAQKWSGNCNEERCSIRPQWYKNAIDRFLLVTYRPGGSGGKVKWNEKYWSFQVFIQLANICALDFLPDEPPICNDVV